MKREKIKTYGIFLGETGGQVCHVLENRFKKKITGCLIREGMPEPLNISKSVKQIDIICLKRDFASELKRRITEDNPLYLVCKLDDSGIGVSIPFIIQMLREKKLPLHCFCIYPENWEGKKNIKTAAGIIQKLKKNQISYSLIKPETWRNEENDKTTLLQEHLAWIPHFTAGIINIYNILINHYEQNQIISENKWLPFSELLLKIRNN